MAEQNTTCLPHADSAPPTVETEALRDELKDWQSLHAMSKQLLATPRLEDQLAILLRTVLHVYGATQGSVTLYDEGWHALVPAASVGLDATALAFVACVPIGAGACGKAFETKGSVTVIDTEADPIFENYCEFSRANGIRAVFSTPFFDGNGSAVGVISIYLPVPRGPTEREQRLTDVCLGHVALLVGRAEAETALSIERVRSQQILQTMSDGFVVMDRQFRVVQINAEALRMDGRSANELLGRLHWDAWPGSESLPLGAYYKNAMESRVAVHFEQVYTREGVTRCFEISAYPYADGLAILYSDVSKRKASELRIRESDQRFQQLANTIPQLAWVADPSGYIEWYNERWYDYTGTDFEEMQGWGWKSVHHPDTLDEATARWKHSIATGIPFEMTFPLRDKHGVYRPFLTLVYPFKDEADRVVQWFGTNTDLSAIEEAQHAVVRSEERLKAGLKAGRMAVWDWDLTSNTMTSSDNAHDLVGYNMCEGHVTWRGVHPDDVGRLRNAASKAIAERTEFHEAVRLVRPDNGERMWVEIRGDVVCDETGSPIKVHGITLDVSERAEAQERLTEASRRKDEFLAMLAHELRNPLSPISSAAHLLTVPNVSPALIKQSSQVIARQVGFMTNLIDDLLDVSRVTRGLVVIERDMLRVTDMLNGAIEQVRPLLDSRRQQLVVDMEPNLSMIRGDQTRLVQVLANLVNNSAKYTPHGGKIEITVRRVAESILIRVADNGMGITPELLPYVFDLFAQGERTPDRSQGGLGLGLALVKSIVELHEGRVAAASAGQGKGATFDVFLPAYAGEAQSSAGALDQAGANSAMPLRIALVDDNIDAALALASVLEAKGHITVVHHDARSLLDTLDDVMQHDVFILDIGLPEMDGYELVRQLRTRANTQCARMVALTGSGQSHDRAIGRAAGFDDYFVKPMDIPRLEQILASVTPRLARDPQASH